MKISVAMPPGPDSVELAQLAHDLGYDRFWLYDSAAIYEDIWITLARIAEHTPIKIGTAVLVPNLRHVMTSASAIATIERLAPGRLVCGWGTGATARWVLNQKALSWKTMRRYLTQLHQLLQGEVVEIDGRQCQMVHHPRWANARPIGTPQLLSALGPWYVVRYHGIWQAYPDAVGNLPLGTEWRAGIDAERPEAERHLAVHEGHVTDVMPRDRAQLDAAGAALATTGWVGTAAEIKAKADEAVAAGATDIMYTPAGPDIAREMTAFAKAVLG